MSHYLVRQLEATPNVAVRLETEIVGGGGEGGSLDHLVLRDRATGAEETVPADGLFPMIGADPQTGWLPRGDRAATRQASSSPAPTCPATRGRSRATVPARDEHAGRARRGRRPPRIGEARRSAVGEGSVAIRMLHQPPRRDDRPAGGEPAPVGDSGARATG